MEISMDWNLCLNKQMSTTTVPKIWKSARFKETQEKVDQVTSWTNDSITQNACLQVLLQSINTPELEISVIYIVYTQMISASACM